MTTNDLIALLQAKIAESPALATLPVKVEYTGPGGCDTCGYGAEVVADIDPARVYDLETRLVISVSD